MVRRIAITGPESTGKSVLAQDLARHYRADWVPEYARVYLQGLRRAYTMEDILVIAKGQLRLEEEAARKARGFLFCDTDFLVARIWSEFRYGTCHPWIVRQSERHVYDLYLLCNTDVPWADDPLREHPNARQELFDLYQQALVRMNLSYFVISGTGEARTRDAISAIDTSFIQSRK
jgi:NadR type nicotinamide-nucleotide adenylyltransferase